MYFIQETDKLKPIFDFLGIVKLKDDKILIPKITSKNVKSIAKKTLKEIKKTNSNSIIISKELQKNQEYINYLNSSELKIVQSKWLFKLMSNEVLDYIITTKNEKLEKNDVQISILINECNNIVIENIKEILLNYKNVIIVTNHRERFKMLEKNFLEEYGIMIIISNNKRRSLIKSDIILNFDFPEEQINKYVVADKAIIVNFEDKIEIHKKRFCGTIINDYEIEFNLNKINEFIKFDKSKSEKYYLRELYEGNINKRQSISGLKRTLKDDGVIIKSLNAI